MASDEAKEKLNKLTQNKLKTRENKVWYNYYSDELSNDLTAPFLYCVNNNLERILEKREQIINALNKQGIKPVLDDSIEYNINTSRSEIVFYNKYGNNIEKSGEILLEELSYLNKACLYSDFEIIGKCIDEAVDILSNEIEQKSSITFNKLMTDIYYCVSFDGKKKPTPYNKILTKNQKDRLNKLLETFNEIQLMYEDITIPL